MEVLPCELVIKFSDYLDKFPNSQSVWNCGATYFKNKWRFLCRNETSKWTEEYLGKKFDWEVRAVPVLAEFDSSFNLERVIEVSKSENRVLSDTRLFTFGDSLYSSGTFRNKKIHSDGKRKVDQFLARIIDSHLIFLPFEHNFPLPEKNWSFIRSDKLYFENCEQKEQLTRNLLSYEKGKLNIVRKEFTPYRLRGNCQSIEVEDGLLTLYHHHKKRYYWHVWGLHDLEWPFSIKKISQPFRFSLGNNKNEHIQFVTGLEKKEEDVFVSYGVQDSDNYFVKIKLEDVYSLF